jgi:hypothetical protein
MKLSFQGWIDGLLPTGEERRRQVGLRGGKAELALVVARLLFRLGLRLRPHDWAEHEARAVQPLDVLFGR